MGISFIFRLIGSSILSISLFAGVLAFALMVTKGSAWMLAFFPVALAAMFLPPVLIVLLPALADEDSR